MILRVSMSLSVLLFAANVFAYPKMGDVSVLNMNNQYKIELINKGFNSGTAMWTILTNVYDLKSGNSLGSSTESRKRDEIVDRAVIQKVLKNCRQANGTPEQVQVPAGKFNTCKLAVEGGHIWVGDVPFGIIRQVTDKAQFELMSFTNGQ